MLLSSPRESVGSDCVCRTSLRVRGCQSMILCLHGTSCYLWRRPNKAKQSLQPPTPNTSAPPFIATPSSLPRAYVPQEPAQGKKEERKEKKRKRKKREKEMLSYNSTVSLSSSSTSSSPSSDPSLPSIASVLAASARASLVPSLGSKARSRRALKMPFRGVPSSVCRV